MHRSNHTLLTTFFYDGREIYKIITLSIIAITICHADNY